MDNSMKSTKHVHPMNKVHKSFEKNLHEHEKKTFGGMFYTDKAKKLHIAVMNSRDPLVEQMAADNVVFHEVKHSWEDLNDVQNAVTSIFNKYGIHTASFEPEANRINIGVETVNGDVIRAIQAEMKGMGYADNSMYGITQMDRISRFKPMNDSDAVVAEAVNYALAAEAVSADEVNALTVMPGGMIQVKNNNGSYVQLCSVNFGYIYNNTPYLVGAGHTGSAGYVGCDAYYVPPIIAVNGEAAYPIAGMDTTYNAVNRVKIGVVALQRLGGNYDLRTIRITEPNINFTHVAYNGCRVSELGGTVTQGAPLRICGVTTRYDADYEVGYCANAQTSVSAYDTTMTNMIKLDIGANNGTSGGPVMTPRDDGTYRLVGIASVNGVGVCYAAPVRYMMSTYGLSMMSEGSIAIG